MANLEGNFFGRIAHKLFANCFYYYENSFKDAKAYPFRLLLSSVFLFLGKFFFFIFTLQRKLLSFLEKGGAILTIITLIFCCYLLSLDLLRS